MSEEIKVKSLRKALSILECFTIKAPEQGITEISEKLGLNKSNVHNIISTFEHCGYVERNPATARYRLGSRILELAYVLNAGLGLQQVVRPFINALAQQVGEVVYFGIPKDGRVLYMDGGYPDNALTVRSMMGEKAEMYCTAIGKAMLAFLPGEEMAPALNRQSMLPFTPATLTSRAALLEDLAACRARGYSVDNMEHEFGIRCVGVPVFNRNGALIGAVSVSGPSPRLEQDKVEAYAGLLKECAQNISQRLP